MKRQNKGKYIQNLRKRLGLTQKKFGEYFYKSRDAIASYENNRANPSAEMWIKIKKLSRKIRNRKPIDELIKDELIK